MDIAEVITAVMLMVEMVILERRKLATVTGGFWMPV